MPDKPILALDFDGVIHRYSKGWQEGVIYDPPTDGFKEWLVKAREHFTIVIVSSRLQSREGYEAMYNWMVEHEIPYREELVFSQTRPPAFITIDDRAIQFSGRWDWLDPRDLREFKPWNQR